jgi:hypothetical protein
MPIPTGKGLVDPIFLHELALELRMPVGEMCERMTAHELQRWVAFFQLRARKQQAEQDAREGIQRGLPALVPGGSG